LQTRPYQSECETRRFTPRRRNDKEESGPDGRTIPYARIAESLLMPGAKKKTLFGSYAEGRSTDSSDLDLTVILPESAMEYMARCINFERIICPRIPLNLVVYIEEEAEKMRDTPLYEKDPGRRASPYTAMKNEVILHRRHRRLVNHRGVTPRQAFCSLLKSRLAIRSFRERTFILTQ